MRQINDKKLLFLIKYTPAIIVAISAIAINIIVIRDTHKEAQLSINSLRNDVTEQQKSNIKQRVEQNLDVINYEKSAVVERLKVEAKSRVNVAHTTALHIFNSNKDKTKKEIQTMISDALSTVRFFEGRGYFFIFQMDGVNVMHALKPQLQGKSAWEAKDVHGTYILQEHIKKIKEQGGEAFYQWWYQKPGEPTHLEFQKVGFGKYFAPYDWFIGTGEYIANIESDVQKQLLKRISNFDNTKNESVFVLDKTGKFLAHGDERYIGKYVHEVANLTKEQFINSSTQDLSRGDFVEYECIERFVDNDHKIKVSYLQSFDEWGWVVGTSFYKNDIESKLAITQKELAEINDRKLLKILLLSLFSTLLVVGLSLFVSHVIAQRFKRFQKRIEKDFKRITNTKNEMQKMALHDSLTGLPNRTCLVQEINHAMKTSSCLNKDMAIVFVDLDDFKKLNDHYGHAYGDKLLEQISRHFEALLGEDDSVSRFGGDEFIFCFPGLNGCADALKKVLAIQNVFKNHFLIDGKQLTTQCSMGISMFPSDSNNAEELITKADIVLYRSKAQGKNNHMFYSDQINDEVQFNYQLEEQLKHALERNEISTVYQPQIDLKTHKIVSLEVLARWNNSQLGNVSPMHFIEVAEDTGLIHDIGLFIFQDACRNIATLSECGHPSIQVSVNVSPKQLMQEGFVDLITSITKESGVDNSRVTIEITENVLIAEINKVLPILNTIRGHGFGISLDDFGTGYSSLNYLNTLPISEIKIDQGFIKDMLDNVQTDTLIKAIIAISNAYEIKVVAEGVETKEQHQRLQEYGCDLNQGYYYSKPVPIDQISELLNLKELVET
ncbi:EAL domain-containing protein [uncultured Vibrio sp.]|uniref:bifunctional diguanylate cyclase/phosphodiesterase n=1 Tax=uncultured Vibrio sp. TaxID=114054 RepID=UPI0025D4802A|nr:EAL domain-containing protein [uncultured Vibrio sp.]